MAPFEEHYAPRRPRRSLVSRVQATCAWRRPHARHSSYTAAIAEASGAEVIQERLDALPLVTVEAGRAVFLAGSRTDRLLFLKEGSVVVIKDGAEIARVTQPRAVMAHGELSPWADPLGVIEQKRLGGQGVCADRL